MDSGKEGGKRLATFCKGLLFIYPTMGWFEDSNHLLFLYREIIAKIASHYFCFCAICQGRVRGLQPHRDMLAPHRKMKNNFSEIFGIHSTLKTVF